MPSTPLETGRRRTPRRIRPPRRRRHWRRAHWRGLFGVAECGAARDYGTIIVGERTSIQDGAIIHAVDAYPTVIGDDCVVGHLAHLEGCVIEDRALVGSGAIVLHQATVHSGATVGAGAVVRNRIDVPANALPSAFRR